MPDPDDGAGAATATDDVPATGGDGDATGLPLPLGTTAALVGEYRWIEQALYRLTGAWVRSVPVPSVQLHLDAQSMRHAWHAELWAERLPVLAGVDPDRLTAPSAPAAALVAALEGTVVPPEGPGSSWPAADEDRSGPGALPLLAGLYRVVLPRLVTTYDRHLQGTSAVTDAPTRRALRLVLADEVEDWTTGERLVQRLMARPHDVAAVHAFVERLEAALVAAGARVGLVPLPDVLVAD